jgi:hypothetical protein
MNTIKYIKNIKCKLFILLFVGLSIPLKGQLFNSESHAFSIGYSSISINNGIKNYLIGYNYMTLMNSDSSSNFMTLSGGIGLAEINNHYNFSLECSIAGNLIPLLLPKLTIALVKDKLIIVPKININVIMFEFDFGLPIYKQRKKLKTGFNFSMYLNLHDII